MQGCIVYNLQVMHKAMVFCNSTMIASIYSFNNLTVIKERQPITHCHSVLYLLVGVDFVCWHSHLLHHTLVLLVDCGW